VSGARDGLIDARNLCARARTRLIANGGGKRFAFSSTRSQAILVDGFVHAIRIPGNFCCRNAPTVAPRIVDSARARAVRAHAPRTLLISTRGVVGDLQASAEASRLGFRTRSGESSRRRRSEPVRRRRGEEIARPRGRARRRGREDPLVPLRRAHQDRRVLIVQTGHGRATEPVVAMSGWWRSAAQGS